MINVTRQAESPTSLQTEEIKNYISDLANYIADPKVHAKPTQPPNYRNSDLLDAFDRCFYSKCYLTELKFTNSYSMDIEHFVGQSENALLRYEWTNLFPADHASNMMKPRTTPVGGYLNPCDPNDDVEIEILYSLSAYGETPSFDRRNAANVKALNTANLLNRIHNGHDNNTRNSTATLRHAIHTKYIEVLNKIIEWQAQADGTQLKNQYTRELKDMLSRKSSFTMLIRSMPAVILYVPADFLD